MTRFYQAQSTTMRRVRFFIFPHWVLGQCENLMSERFGSMPCHQRRGCSVRRFLRERLLTMRARTGRERVLRGSCFCESVRKDLSRGNLRAQHRLAVRGKELGAA